MAGPGAAQPVQAGAFFVRDQGKLAGVIGQVSSIEAQARPSCSFRVTRRIARPLTTTMDTYAEVVGDACLSREASAGADGSKAPTSLEEPRALLKRLRVGGGGYQASPRYVPTYLLQTNKKIR